uniref:Uncharacterized protein n=1 Tax=viral metagenome TaxID=1070528 RepID=A0A6C0EQ55_9ZZZZ
MSTRAKKLREQNQVVKIVKDLIKRMETFEDAVEELKLLKDTVCDINEQLSEQEATNAEAMRKLKENLRDNKLRVLNETVEEMGRVIVSSDELEEYKQEATRWKAECSKVKEECRADVKSQVDEQMSRQLKILELQNENKLASLNASNESYKTEVQNLKETIKRMAQELDSQKKLTADVAGARRPVSSSENKSN